MFDVEKRGACEIGVTVIGILKRRPMIAGYERGVARPPEGIPVCGGIS